MVSQFYTPLDSLARNGIIDFDADAYIRGTTPRYVGKPNDVPYLPFDQPLPELAPAPIKPHIQPRKDEFVKEEESGSNPHWKTTLAQLLFATLAVAGGIKYKDKIISFIKSLSPEAIAKKAAEAKAAKEAAVKAAAAKAAAKAAAPSLMTRVKAKINELVKKMPELVEKVKTLPKWGKITLGSVAGLLGLYAVYKALPGKERR